LITPVSSTLAPFTPPESKRTLGGDAKGPNQDETKQLTAEEEKESSSAGDAIPGFPLGMNSTVCFLVESEAEYVKKLEVLVEKHKLASNASRQKIFRTSSSNGSAASQASTSSSVPEVKPLVGRGTVLRLASSFGQTTTSNETAILMQPSVFSCLSACEQMLTVHRSLAGDLAALGSDSLQRLASLTRIYTSYGATLVEAFFIAVNASSSPTNNKSTAAMIEEEALSSQWFRLGASQSDPENALRWVLMAGGCVRPLKQQQQDKPVLFVDLLLAPLQRMNDYCQFARELDSPALGALNETRRLLTKAIMRKSNTRLLRELDNGFTDLDMSLVDVRRWMIRSSTLVMYQHGFPESLVQVFLFSDMLVVAQSVGGVYDRWSVIKVVRFAAKESNLFLRDAAIFSSTPVSPSNANAFMLNPSTTPLGDARFAFEVGSSEEDSVTLMMPNVSTTIQKQAAQYWTKLGMVAFDRETATAIGPGGFSSVDSAPKRSEAATVRTTDRSKDMKRKQQLRWEWMSDIGRLIRIWGGAKTDACWFDDIVALRLLYQQQRLKTSSLDTRLEEHLSEPPALTKSDSAPV